MNKRVALINPPSPFLINEKVTANIGLLHVATEMRKRGIDVKVFDFCGNQEYEDKFFNRFDFSENSSFFKGAHGKYRCSVRTEELSAEDLVRIRDDLEREVKEKLYGENI